MTALFESRDLADSVADKLKVFAQPLRLMILSCLLRDDRNVADIGQATGIGQPTLSQQLAELRRAELVSTRKEGKQVWYALADEGVVLCVRSMEAVFGGVGEVPQAPQNPDQRELAEPASGVAGFARIV